MSEKPPKSQSSQGFDNLRFGRRNRLGGKRDKNHAADWETVNRGHGQPGWLVFGGSAAIVLLGAGAAAVMFFGNRGPQGKSQTKAPAAERLEVEQKAHFDPGAAKDWKGPLPYRIAESFTKAATNTERLKWVRNPQQAAPLIEAFFQDGPGAREKILGVAHMGPATNGQLSFQRFQVRMDNGNSRLLCVVLNDDGGSVDFECYARHGSATWPDLLSGKVAEADEVRVFIKRGFTFVHGFSDENKWSSFLATTPDWAVPLNFYALRGSETDKELNGQLGGGAMRATLAIRSVGDSHQKRQFEVTKVVAAGWVR